MGKRALSAVRFLCIGVTATCVLGCTTTGGRVAGPSLDRGIVVGGGFNIECRTPEIGTIYLVDADTGKCLYSKEVMGHALVQIGATEFGDMAEMGLDINSLNPVLYFVPLELEEDSE